MWNTKHSESLRKINAQVCRWPCINIKAVSRNADQTVPKSFNLKYLKIVTHEFAKLNPQLSNIGMHFVVFCASSFLNRGIYTPDCDKIRGRQCNVREWKYEQAFKKENICFQLIYPQFVDHPSLPIRPCYTCYFYIKYSDKGYWLLYHRTTIREHFRLSTACLNMPIRK